MANSDRKIVRGVQVGTQTYVAGQEDELDNVLSPQEAARLAAKGYLEGKWVGNVKPEPEATPAKNAKDEKTSAKEK